MRNEHIIGAQDGPVPAGVEPDRAIVIEGGIWTTLATAPGQSNGNSRGRSARQGDVPGCHGVILLSNVCGAVVQKLTVRQSRAFGVHISNCRDFLVENVAFEDHGRDGVHVNGPTADGIIRHVRGVTHDDFVALNAWEWMGYPPGTRGRPAAESRLPEDHPAWRFGQGPHCALTEWPADRN